MIYIILKQENEIKTKRYGINGINGIVKNMLNKCNNNIPILVCLNNKEIKTKNDSIL